MKEWTQASWKRSVVCSRASGVVLCTCRLTGGGPADGFAAEVQVTVRLSWRRSFSTHEPRGKGSEPEGGHQCWGVHWGRRCFLCQKGQRQSQCFRSHSVFKVCNRSGKRPWPLTLLRISVCFCTFWIFSKKKCWSNHLLKNSPRTTKISLSKMFFSPVFNHTIHSIP